MKISLTLMGVASSCRDWGDTEYDDIHSTQVASVVGAATNNSKGLASLGWNIKMIPYKYTPGEDGGTLPAKITTAVEQGCDVLNFSFNTARTYVSEQCYYGPHPCELLYSENYPSVANAIAQGVVVVAAVGNEPLNADQPPDCDPCDVFPYTPYPAAYSGVIGVSATDINDVFAGGENWNYGSFVDVAAPGYNVWTATYGAQNYMTASGTSFSTPHVAALAGLILSVNPSLTPAEVEQIITSTAQDLGTSGRDDYYGYGRINAYKALVLALAYANKSTSSQASWSNNARVLVRGRFNKLHEVFTSSGEIVYRRSSDNGSTWDVTTIISPWNGSNKLPCIVTTPQFANDDGVHVVWERKAGTNTYEVWYSYSTNSGLSWSTPEKLPGASAVTVSGWQTEGPMPVVTAVRVGANYKLLAVFCSQQGLRYRTAPWNGSTWVWETPNPDILYSSLGSSYDQRVWFPSLANYDTWASLTCDYRSYQGVYSRIYNGSSWTSETSVSQAVGTIQDRHSQVAIGYEYGPYPIAAWAAQRSGDPDYRIVSRQGYSNSTWSSWFMEFAKIPGINSLYPALTDYMLSPSGQGDGWWGTTIVYHTSDKRTKMKLYFDYEWWDNTISTNGYFPNITHETSTSGKPKYLWTDQSASPYQIYLSSQYLPKGGPTPFIHHRRAVIANTVSNTSLAIELGEFQVHTIAGDIIVIDFPKHRLGEKVDLTLHNLWDYLTSEPLTLPEDAESVSFSYQIYTSSPYDSSGTKPPPPFTGFDFELEVRHAASGQRLGLFHQESIAEPNGQVNVSATRSVDISPLRGRTLVLRPTVGHLPPVALADLTFGLGDIWIEGPEVQRGLAGKEVAKTTPGGYMLSQNYPNPANPTTTIRYRIPEDEYVSLKVYDLLGKEVVTLVNGAQKAGEYRIQFDSRGLASGVYLCRLQAGHFSKVIKLMVLK